MIKDLKISKVSLMAKHVLSLLNTWDLILVEILNKNMVSSTFGLIAFLGIARGFTEVYVVLHFLLSLFFGSKMSIHILFHFIKILGSLKLLFLLRQSI